MQCFKAVGMSAMIKEDSPDREKVIAAAVRIMVRASRNTVADPGNDPDLKSLTEVAEKMVRAAVKKADAHTKTRFNSKIYACGALAGVDTEIQLSRTIEIGELDYDSDGPGQRIRLNFIANPTRQLNSDP